MPELYQISNTVRPMEQRLTALVAPARTMFVNGTLF